MHVLIIGGSDAGISAALRARELDPSVEVTLVVADAFPNFSVCGIPFYISREVEDWRSLAHRTRAQIEEQGIRLLLDTRAMSIDATRHVVTVRAQAGGESEILYDRLVIGTGATAIRPPIEGIDLPGVFLMRSMDDCLALDRQVEATGARRIAIVGGGYIGLEMADAFALRQYDVTLIEALPAVLQTCDEDIGHRVADKLGEHGVKVLTGQPIARIEQAADGLALLRGAGRQIEADIVLVAAGARPDTVLARAAGVELGARGALAVNRGMATNLPDVFAAGDCVHTWHTLLQRHVYLPLGTTAHKQGRIAGENAVGGTRQFAGSLGSQVVKIFDLVVARTGLREAEAREAAFEPFTADAAVDDHKAYYPGARPILFRITGDRRTDRLLGAQVAGSYGSEVAKRVDVLAAAIFHGMTVEGLADLDLTYTPPLGSPWDSVQMAAQAYGRARRREAAS